MSCYSAEHGLAFIHIPKNAGTAIRKVLNWNSFDTIDAAHRTERDPALANHFPVWRIETLLDATGEDVPFGAMHRFMVVRSPWERLVSLYRHRMRKLDLWYEGKPRNTEEDKAVAREGFVPWLLRTPSEGDRVLTRMPQMSWGRDRDGSAAVHTILRFESLDADWPDFCQTVGLPHKPLPRVNVGRTDGWKAEYTQEAIDHVARYFRDDIERFGYEI